ncbi:MAG: hypothetical protein QX198_15555 [Methylococcaceae bacterium]
MSDQEHYEIDHSSGTIEAIPTPKGTRYRCQLNTAQDVRREMAKVYRESRSGLIDVADSTKHVWVLAAIGKAIETSDIEKRIEALELKT